MDKAETLQVTMLLMRMKEGDAEASDDLARLLYGELRDMAKVAMGKGGAGQTLQPTALVHEAWLKLAQQDGVDWENRSHFIRVAATAMRTILVDRARARGAIKRGGGRRPLELDDSLAVTEEDSGLLLEVHEALERLAELDPDLARVAELHCFMGLTNADIAEVLDTSQRTVERDWRAARAWLQRDLK